MDTYLSRLPEDLTMQVCQGLSDQDLEAFVLAQLDNGCAKLLINRLKMKQDLMFKIFSMMVDRANEGTMPEMPITKDASIAQLQKEYTTINMDEVEFLIEKIINQVNEFIDTEYLEQLPTVFERLSIDDQEKLIALLKELLSASIREDAEIEINDIMDEIHLLVSE